MFFNSLILVFYCFYFYTKELNSNIYLFILYNERTKKRHKCVKNKSRSKEKKTLL